MIVCIAEKPSVGREIAAILGATTKRDGYMEGNGYRVTWAFGHLCSLLEPADYQQQWKRWDFNALPIVPQKFDVKISDDPGAQKQMGIITSLIAEAEMVINCGDAGQEGELIQRWIQYKAGCRVPVKRLWISSLTQEAIREGFQSLHDQQEYQGLYIAGYMRAISDWLLGMNATRAYTIRYGGPYAKGKQPLSVGRVQTPTLALIVNRYWEIKNFVPRQYWELKTTYRDTLFSLQQKNEDEDAAPPTGEQMTALLESIKGRPLTVTSVEKKPGKEFAPRLYDLTTLQVDCNKKFGFSADQTLSLIQSLYEKKVTTYPRVDTTFLSDDIYPKVPSTLRGIQGAYPDLVAPLLDGRKLPKSKKVFDNAKVTDHHAIIPTGQPPSQLTDQEQKVFDLVARHFIAAFYPECKVSTTTVLAEVQPAEGDPVPFKTTGRQILDPGWRVCFPRVQKQSTDDEEHKEEEEKTLPAFAKGESGPHEPQLLEKWTNPPKPYTEATLLRAMETAGKIVDDEELRDAMKENGIGRPSTRASIIETLFKRKYIQKERKSLQPTETGLQLIATIDNALLKSPELTGRWEKKLREIEQGSYAADAFLTELKEMVINLVREVQIVGCACPQCRMGRIVRGNSAFGCSNWRTGCQFREPFFRYAK